MAVTNTPAYYDASTINAVKVLYYKSSAIKLFEELIVVVF
jgi:hypothetical protein